MLISFSIWWLALVVAVGGAWGAQLTDGEKQALYEWDQLKDRLNKGLVA